MNPLTLVKRIKEINSKEAALGISEKASWHAKYKESAYVFAGGIPFDLTEGDLLAIFSQYGEIVDVNLVRDKATGKSKGFAFVAYQDQRSTNLAVDNLNGASILSRIIRVDHVTNYKKKEEEDEELEQQKREERGVCRAFQRGDCNRGASCKFSHDEQRCANTGWGPKDNSSRWEHDKHEAPPIRSGKGAGNFSDRIPESKDHEVLPNVRSDGKGRRLSRARDDEEGRKSYPKQSETNQDRRSVEKRSDKSVKEPNYRDLDGKEKRLGEFESQRSLKEDWDGRRRESRSLRHESEQNPREGHVKRERSGRYDSEPKLREDHHRNGRGERSGRHESERNGKDDYNRSVGEKRSRYDEDSSSRHQQEEGDLHVRRARR
ncbi:hypothetical protein IFM89_031592 [Coptis chinensis]|uniref:Uncharacterized protein n=1 Tax=Coptis chinensis TaxID=261450 RepID=A0A835LK19_9MAGN|nr:hypothetical protein IFM89_031592 [Coptis chinensis]